MDYGVQCYTIRECCSTLSDLEKSLEKCAAIGYQTVQLSGVCDYDAYWMRDLTQKLGLKVVATHISPTKLLEKPEEVVKEHEIMGCDVIGIGSMPKEYRDGPKGARQFLKDYENTMNVFAEHGRKLHYHNHAFEFIRYGHQSLMDVLCEEQYADKLGFIIDTYWVQMGGLDPVQFIYDMKGKCEVIHFKDLRPINRTDSIAEVGEGNLPWERIVKACEETGIQHAVVEQDTCYGRDPFACLTTSYNNMKAKGFIK